jgi:septin family protein
MFADFGALKKAHAARGENVADTLYRVLVLGARGSGKTVFLASLFAHLMVQNRQKRIRPRA